MSLTQHLTYSVKTLRKAGLEARWGYRNRKRILCARDPNAHAAHQRNTWWYVDKDMFEAMKRDGVREAFTNHTLLGDYFSI